MKYPTVWRTRVEDYVSTAFEGREYETWPVICVLPERLLDIRWGIWDLSLLPGRFRSLYIFFLRSNVFLVCVGIRE